MSKETLLAIDLGVSYVKAGLYDLAGRCLRTAKKQSPGDHQGRGVFIQKGDDYLKVVLELLTEVAQKSPQHAARIAAITFSGQLAGAVGVDRQWRDLTTCSSNMDTRYSQHVTDMIKVNGSGMSRLSGTNFPYWGAKLLWWKKEHPELYHRVVKFVFLAGFIIGRLGEITIDRAFTDKTYLAMSGLADTVRGQWSDELCASFSLDKAKLPAIVESYDIVGRLSRANAALCGLQEGIPLVAGAGDKPAGALGAGLCTPGMTVDESASFGAFSICTDRFVPDLERGTVEVLASPIPGLYYPTSFLLGSGITISWLAGLFSGGEGSGSARLKRLETRARSIMPGSDGLLAVGLLDGRAYPYDPDIRGLWIGHTWIHQQEHFYRSLLESYAYENRYFFSVMRELYSQNTEEVVVIGGGAESDLWNQIKSDVLGVPYVRLNRNDFALLGGALLGGFAVGFYNDLVETSRKYVREVKRFMPNDAEHRKYDEFYHLYLSVFEKTRTIFEALHRIA